MCGRMTVCLLTVMITRFGYRSMCRWCYGIVLWVEARRLEKVAARLWERLRREPGGCTDFECVNTRVCVSDVVMDHGCGQGHGLTARNWGLPGPCREQPGTSRESLGNQSGTIREPSGNRPGSAGPAPGWFPDGSRLVPEWFPICSRLLRARARRAPVSSG